MIRNPGTKYAYSVWLSNRVSYVLRGDAVHISSLQTEPAAFASAAAYAAWRHGEWALPEVGSLGSLSFKESEFNVVGSAGPPVTFVEAARFGASRATIDAAVESAVAAPPSQARVQKVFDAFAHLLAFGSLSYAARVVVTQSMLSLPTATDCTPGRAGSKDVTTALCLTGNNIRERVILDPRSDRVLRIVDYLDHGNVLYPDIRPGGMIQSDTFAQ